MNSRIAHAIENSKTMLIRLAAPTLKPEPLYVPLRPPMFRATATLRECLATKGLAIQ